MSATTGLSPGALISIGTLDGADLAPVRAGLGPASRPRVSGQDARRSRPAGHRRRDNPALDRALGPTCAACQAAQHAARRAMPTPGGWHWAHGPAGFAAELCYRRAIQELRQLDARMSESEAAVREVEFQGPIREGHKPCYACAHWRRRTDREPDHVRQAGYCSQRSASWKH